MEGKSENNIFRDFALDYYNNDIGKGKIGGNELSNSLKNILQNLEINDWDEFENFFEIGINKWLKKGINYIKNNTSDKPTLEKINVLKNNLEEFENWLVDALQSEKAKRTAKWYYVLHPEELDDFIFDIIKGRKNIGKNQEFMRKSMNTDSDVSNEKLELDNDSENKIFDNIIKDRDKHKNDVRQVYKMVLNRRPDNSELLHYSNMLKYGVINTERIEEILRGSDDYKKSEGKRKELDKKSVETKSAIDGVSGTGVKNKVSVVDNKMVDMADVADKTDVVDTNIYDKEDICSKDDYYIDIINKAYDELLERNIGDNGLYVDDSGLKTYLPLMRNGMTEEKLRSILKSSPEYKDNISMYQPEEERKIELDDSDRVFIKEKEKKKEVKQKESKQEEKESYVNMVDRKTDFSSVQLIYCMMGTNRLFEIKPYVESVLPYVDKFIFVDGGSEDGTVEYLNSLNKNKNKDKDKNKKEEIERKVEVYVHQWEDRFSGQRNNYLAKLRERDYNGWVVVSDTDEWYPVESLKRIRKIIPELEEKKYNGIQVQVIDVTVDDDDFNKIIESNKNQYWKALVFKYYPDLRYEGEPHETLMGTSIRWYKSDIVYEHRRSKLHIWKRATENYFISNSNRYSERWAEFRYLCVQEKISTFKEFWKLFEESKLPAEIVKWIWLHKDDNEDSGDSELREMSSLYFDVLPQRRAVEMTEMKTDVKVVETCVKPEVIVEKTENVNKVIKENVKIVKPDSVNIGYIRNELKDDITRLLQEFEKNVGLTVDIIYLSRLERTNEHDDVVYVKTISMK